MGVTLEELATKYHLDMDRHDLNYRELILVPPSQYLWSPQTDITAYEVALALPLLVTPVWDPQPLIENLPEEVQRHFSRLTNE